jgi:hypothetical protein
MIITFQDGVCICAGSWAPTPPDGVTYVNIDLDEQGLEFDGLYDWSYTEETVDGVTTYTAVKGDLTPIDEELKAFLEADVIATQYQRDRSGPEGYPDVKEQLDMLWHAIDDGTLDKTSDFYTELKSVKDAHPKP